MPPFVKTTMAELVNAPAASAPRPRRADALRNYEKLLAAARETFAQDGASTPLETVAQRAGAGIGTLYRHFPTRQNLLEAVYVDEVEALARSAADLSALPPWDALVAWLHRFVAYFATKHALAEEMLNYVDPDADLFRSCRSAVYAAGEPLLARAQEAGVARTDTTIVEVIQLAGGVAKISAPEPGQVDRILDLALDGLRPRPA